jgi:RNA polymerase sigma-70 factor (ECF subfamily)
MGTLQSALLPQFDHDYLQGLSQHDPETESHFAGHFTRVLGGRLRNRYPRVHPEDLLQETLTRVLSAVHSPARIRRPESFAAFVESVSRNIAYESFRVRGRLQSLESMAAEPVQPGEGPDAIASRLETCARVHQVLSLLPSAERRLLSAVYFEEKSRAEICLLLGITRSNLRVRLHRAKRQFLSLWQARESPAPRRKRLVA